MPKTTKKVVPIEEQFSRFCELFDRMQEDVSEIRAIQEEILEKLQNLNLGSDFSIFSTPE